MNEAIKTLNLQPRSQGLSGAGQKETLVGAGHVSPRIKVDQGRGTSFSTLCKNFVLSNPKSGSRFFKRARLTRRHVSQQSAFFRHDEQLFGL